MNVKEFIYQCHRERLVECSVGLDKQEYDGLSKQVFQNDLFDLICVNGPLAHVLCSLSKHLETAALLG